MTLLNSPTTSPFNDVELRKQIRDLRYIDNRMNLHYLVREYITLFVILGAAIGILEYQHQSGLHLFWGIPVVALAVVLIGGLQHRLAGLGHEASHYTLLRHKWWNDVLGDLLCMFPILATVHLYRISHLAHHQFPNDPDRDPNVVETGDGKAVNTFPMPHWLFVIRYHLRLLTAPLAFLKFQWEYLNLNSLGRRPTFYDTRNTGPDRSKVGRVLAIGYLIGLVALQWTLTTTGNTLWLLPLGLGGILLVSATCVMLPERVIGRATLRRPCSNRTAAILRLSYYTVGLVVLGLFRDFTDGRSTAYFFLLWVLPLLSSFTFFVMLRDVYQHANADSGRLTNTRVFYADPFTRWAVFVYGQDMHLPHHLFPMIPHYRLQELHQLLQRNDPQYEANVVECHGTFANQTEQPTILDAMATNPLPQTTTSTSTPIAYSDH